MKSTGFSIQWAGTHARDREQMSPRRLAVEYQCTYLTPKTVALGSSILDAGCGGGFLNRYLEQSEFDFSYVGLDWSEASLQEARRHFPHRSFVRGDLQALPFRTNAFDCAYSRDVIIHCPDPYQGIRELYRVSRSLVLRLRTAEIDRLFSTSYREKEVLHHFFPVQELVEVLRQQDPRPVAIRYKTHWAYPRRFEEDSFNNRGRFSTYFSTDLWIRKGEGQTSLSIRDDSGHRLFHQIRRRWGQPA